MMSLNLPISCALLIAVLLHAPVVAAVGDSGNAPATSSPEGVLTPPRDDGPAVVRVAFHLQNINEIDDEAETFEFTGVLVSTWRDKRQAFAPETVGFKEKFYQGAFQFDELSPAWYPQVVLANVSGQYEKSAVLLRIKPDGTITLVETVNAVAEVDLSLWRYPFDQQSLEAIFEVLGMDKNEVVLEVQQLPSSVDPTTIQLPEWSLTKVDSSIREYAAPYASSSGISSAYVFTLDVKRQPFFVIRLVGIPLAMIVFLTWSVFWMDSSAMAERISVSFVGILTAVAYQIVIGGIMPKISHVSIMHAFLNLSFLVLCATVVVNLVVGIRDKNGDPNGAALINRRCRWMFPAVYFGLVLLATAIAFMFL